ncbi:MAG: twin-arginine translocase TatA/TatE family subunit [Chloroflexi bacterium]|nr:twin-arginine translocase TatA/TatE family subunit [Chloroflexota bacterium]
MFNIGPGELIVVLILALIVFGPGRLPEIAATLGRTLREFKKATDEITETVAQDLQLHEHPSAKKVVHQLPDEGSYSSSPSPSSESSATPPSSSGAPSDSAKPSSSSLES